MRIALGRLVDAFNSETYSVILYGKRNNLGMKAYFEGNV
jgi:hypothetical protein